MLVDATILLLFPAMMAFAAASDLLTMTISNRISLALVAGFFALAIVLKMGMADIGWHLAAGALVLAVTFAFFARGWIGGGDAKLAAATALWFGFEHLLDYALYASLLGGALTLLLIGFRFSLLPAPLAGQAWLARLHRSDAGIPYGIALAAAALLVYPQTAWMRAVGF
ncbi:MAG: prepilin peptidase [Proteobacteria bacterium]|nr:prepilin peptidase [Pseudomonadota bacterium]